MSDSDKLTAFGSWLTTKRLALHTELYSLAINRDVSIDTVRIKAGHIEAYTQILEAFTELYRGDLNTFLTERMGQKHEED